MTLSLTETLFRDSIFKVSLRGTKCRSNPVARDCFASLAMTLIRTAMSKYNIWTVQPLEALAGVIASPEGARQSKKDCFVAVAPRNDTSIYAYLWHRLNNYYRRLCFLRLVFWPNSDAGLFARRGHRPVADFYFLFKMRCLLHIVIFIFLGLWQFLIIFSKSINFSSPFFVINTTLRQLVPLSAQIANP